MSRILSYFLRGLVFLAPIGLTAWVLYSSFVSIDGWARRHLGLEIPGLGVAITLAAVTLVGMLASNYLTRTLLHALERLLQRVPFIKMLHGSVKDLLNAFVGEKRRFDKPVLVSLTADGTVKALGFVTREDVALLGEPDAVAVYFPQSYNFAGQVVIVPRSACRALPLPSSEVMALVVSGGVSGKGE